MTINKNFTFGIAYANRRVQDKNTFNWNHLYYDNHTTNIDELVEKVKKGYPFTSMMNETPFCSKTKTKDNFKQTSIIALDFDDCPKCFEIAYDDTDVTPTIAYTTPNDGKPGKGNRFRFVYVLSEPIKSLDEYQVIYDAMRGRMGMKTDNALSSGVANIGGMSSTGKLKVSYNIFDKEDFLIKENISSLLKKRDSEKSFIKNNNKTKKRENGINLNDTFKQDMDELNFNQFLMKYRTVYEYFDKTSLTFNNGYAIIPENYYEIRRKWSNETFETKNGIQEVTRIRRLKDGEGRRDKMFVQCLIRRRIKPNITLEELVYNLVCERQWYFNNDDNALNNPELVRIAMNAMNIEEITIPPTDTGKKFIVDKEYWASKGINANQAKQIIKKEIRSNEIGNLYDCSLSDEENLRVLEGNGVKCSLSTLKRWKKENGLTRKYEKKRVDF